MDDRFQSFRQPFVTATGILLGFLFNFAGDFVKAEDPTNDFIAFTIFGCLIVGVVCLVVTLARALSIRRPEDDQLGFHERTLRIFLIGTIIASFGVFIDMSANFLLD